jgi:hypothetical protein
MATPLICGMPRVARDNGSGSCHQNWRISHFLMRAGAKGRAHDRCANSLSKITSLTLLFSINFDVFHRTETHSQSMICEDGIRGAREKHYVSTGTPGTDIKPTPTYVPLPSIIELHAGSSIADDSAKRIAWRLRPCQIDLRFQNDAEGFPKAIAGRRESKTTQCDLPACPCSPVTAILLCVVGSAANSDPICALSSPA